MKNRNNVILTIIGAATLLVAIIGASFAYFSATSTTVKQNVTTGILKVSITSETVEGGNIKPLDTTQYDTVEEKLSNIDVVKVPVSVIYTGTTVDGYYNIYLDATGLSLKTETDEGKPLTGGSLDQVKWELIKNSDNSVIGSDDFGDVTSGSVTDLKLNTESITITPKETVEIEGKDEYTLLIYIENTEDSTGEDGLPISGVQDQLQGMEITATVKVKAYQVGANPE